jgi:transposase
MICPGFLSSADRIEFEAGVGRQREDHGIARRANTILLLDDGESCARIAKFLYLDDDTIRGWYKSYRQDGWDALAFDGWKGGQSRLKQAQEGALCAWLEARFCRSTVSHAKAIYRSHSEVLSENYPRAMAQLPKSGH